MINLARELGNANLLSNSDLVDNVVSSAPPKYVPVIAAEIKDKGEENVTNDGGNRKFNGKCNLCANPGHMARDCWEDNKNVSKCPANLKSKLNAGMVASDDSKLMLLSFLKVTGDDVEKEVDEESTQSGMPDFDTMSSGMAACQSMRQ